MLTQEQKLELKARIDRERGNFGAVTEEEMDCFPAKRMEMEIPTSIGPAKVVVFEYGEASGERPVILNFHGGGFIGKRMDQDELYCRKMACLFHALVLDVDYKLAPEYPYPAAVTECWEVMKWVWDHQDRFMYHPEKIVLMGHSSGGNLVAGICMKCRDVIPCCVVLDYPPLDLATDPAKKERSVCDMPAERARMYNEQYIPSGRGREAYASPLFAPIERLARFPDTLLISAGEDSLCEEDEEFALRLAQAGVTVTVKRFTESIHGFVINRMCEWEAAMDLIQRFIKAHIS